MDRRKSFVGGAAILGVSGIICKVIGAAFRIPLNNVLGTEGMANYQVAYPLYAALLVVSSSGIPTAISKMVSAKAATGDYRNAHYVFQVAFRMLTLIGIGTTILMLLGASPIASITGVPEAWPTLVAIAPSLFFVSILSAYRGYFQGLQMMTPTAISQLIEQVGKLVVGLMLARAWSAEGNMVMGAAGALVGVTVSELTAMLFLIILYNFNKGSIKYQIRTSPRVNKFDTRKEVINKLLKLAVPVTIGACIMPLVNLIDNAMVINSLKSIGFSQTIAKEKFALLTSFVAPIINMPAVISVALQMSLVPAISSAVAARKGRQAVKTATVGVKLAILIGMPCAVGLFIMGGPVLSLLYRNLGNNYDNLKLATDIMRIMSIGLVFLTLIQTVTGILQGLGRAMIPVRNLAIGAVVKVVASFFLLRNHELNILGAPISTVLCYLTAMLLNMYYLLANLGIEFSFGDYIVRPGLATAGMGGTAYGVYMFLSSRAGIAASAAGAILAAVVVYLLLVLLLGALRPEDAELLPGGRKLDGLMRRLGLWR